MDIIYDLGIYSIKYIFFNISINDNRVISYGTRIIATFVIVTYTMIQGTNLKLTLATMLPIIATVYIVIKLRKYVEKSFKKAQKNFTDLSEYVQDKKALFTIAYSLG